MNKVKLIAVFFAFTICGLTQASDFAAQLQAQGFNKQVRQRRGGITMDRINLPFYGVKTDQGILIVTEGLRRPNGITFSIDSKQYHYEAHDNGEFGGELIAINEQGQKLILSKENTRGFFRLNKQIYALTGLAHLRMDQGRLYRLNESGKKPRLVSVTALADSAVDIAIDSNRVYVLTRNDLEVLEFDQNKILPILPCRVISSS